MRDEACNSVPTAVAELFALQALSLHSKPQGIKVFINVMIKFLAIAIIIANIMMSLLLVDSKNIF